MIRAALRLALVGSLSAAGYSDDHVPVAPPAPGFVPPAAAYPPGPGAPPYEVPPPPPPGLEAVPPAPPAPAPLPVPAMEQGVAPPPRACDCGWRGAASGGVASGHYGAAQPAWGATYDWREVYTGAVAGGMHIRSPYYSYRAPWYSPGPASLNVTIVW